jgi:hypothetical protein
MIIIKVEKVEDFVSFLDRRLGNEILYEFVDSGDPMGTTVILYYLAKIDPLNVIYQVDLFFPKIRDKNEIKKKLDEFQFGQIRLVPGKLREIFMSISS